MEKAEAPLIRRLNGPAVNPLAAQVATKEDPGQAEWQGPQAERADVLTAGMPESQPGAA